MRLSLHNGCSAGVTIISNIFIDYYLPGANGEFVKIYLYLLRCLKGGDNELDLASVADVFDCTESDIMRTLRYWEAQKLVVLSGKDSLTTIDFLDPIEPAGSSQTSAAQRASTGSPASGIWGVSSDTDTSSSSGSSHAVQAGSSSNPVRSAGGSSASVSQMENVRGVLPEAAPSLEPKATQPARAQLSADRIRELKENDDVRQMLFIAEQYLGSTLSRSVTDELLYIYGELHFSVDLIDYLIEYCVSKGSGDIHYIKKVAYSWHENDIRTVTQAKQETTTYHRNYFTILKAFGITNRNPVQAEIMAINRWMKDYGFTLDILTEACSRTVQATGKANFQYADKILSSWKDKGVRHLTDIQALDTLHRQIQADRAEQKSKKKPDSSGGSSGNRFKNFQPRDYDYKELENQLLKE
jgi:DnaD/phage-associated family protein